MSLKRGDPYTEFLIQRGSVGPAKVPAAVEDPYTKFLKESEKKKPEPTGYPGLMKKMLTTYNPIYQQAKTVTRNLKDIGYGVTHPREGVSNLGLSMGRTYSGISNVLGPVAAAPLTWGWRAVTGIPEGVSNLKRIPGIVSNPTLMKNLARIKLHQKVKGAKRLGRKTIDVAKATPGFLVKTGKAVPGVVKEIGKDVKSFAERPFKYAYEDPIDAILTGATLFDLGGIGLKATAKVAAKGAAKQAAKRDIQFTREAIKEGMQPPPAGLSSPVQIRTEVKEAFKQKPPSMKDTKEYLDYRVTPGIPSDAEIRAILKSKGINTNKIAAYGEDIGRGALNHITTSDLENLIFKWSDVTGIPKKKIHDDIMAKLQGSSQQAYGYIEKLRGPIWDRINKDWQRMFKQTEKAAKMVSTKPTVARTALPKAARSWYDEVLDESPFLAKIGEKVKEIDLSYNPIVRGIQKQLLEGDIPVASAAYQSIRGTTPGSHMGKYNQWLQGQQVAMRNIAMGKTKQAFDRLTPKEKELFSDYVEGLKGVNPAEVTPAFFDVANQYARWMRVFATRYMGMPKEAQAKRAYLMLSKGLKRSDFPQDAADRTMENYLAKKQFYGPGVKVGPDEELSVDILRAAYQNIKKKDAAKGLKRIDEPVYYRHLWEEKGNPLYKGEKHSTFFSGINKKYGFEKRAVGAEGYSKDAAKVAEYHAANMVSFVYSKRLIDELKAIGKPLEGKVNFKELQDQGYAVFAPDKFKTIVRAKLNLEGEVLSRLASQGFDDAAEEIGKILKDTAANLQKEIAVVKRNEVYAVPKEAMEAIYKQMRPIIGDANEWARIFWDPALAIWRKSVLYTPRWITNNVAGNIVFNAMAGILPHNYIRALMTKYLKYVPEQVKGSTFTQDVKLGTGKMGKAFFREIPLGWKKDKFGQMKPFKFQAGRFMQEKIIDPVSTLYEKSRVSLLEKGILGANEAAERLARSSHYIQKAIKYARKDVIEKMGRKANKAMSDLDALKYATNRPKLQERAIKSVNEFLYDYRNANRFERQVMKRGFPFYSFMKHVYVLGLTYPFKHPKEAFLYKKIWVDTVLMDKQDIEKTYAEEAKEKGYIDYRRYGGVDIGKDKKGKVYSWQPKTANPISALSELGYNLYDQASRGGNLSTAFVRAASRSGLGMEASPIMSAYMSSLMGIDPYTGKRYDVPGVVNDSMIYPSGKAGPAPEVISPGFMDLFYLRSNPYLRTWKMVKKPHKQYTGTSTLNPRVKGTTGSIVAGPKSPAVPIANLFISGIQERNERGRKVYMRSKIKDIGAIKKQLAKDRVAERQLEREREKRIKALRKPYEDFLQGRGE